MVLMNLHGVSLASVLAALVAFLPGDPVEPNTECGTSAGTFMTSGASATGNSGTSQAKANEEALENLDIQLGTDAGVICEICSTGLQCERRIRGKKTEDVVVTPGDIIDGQFTATATYMGSYIVKCRKCVNGQIGS